MQNDRPSPCWHQDSGTPPPARHSPATRAAPRSAVERAQGVLERLPRSSTARRVGPTVQQDMSEVEPEPRVFSQPKADAAEKAAPGVWPSRRARPFRDPLEPRQPASPVLPCPELRRIKGDSWFGPAWWGTRSRAGPSCLLPSYLPHLSLAVLPSRSQSW